MSYVLRDDNWIKVANEAHEAARMRRYYEKLEDLALEKLKVLSNGEPSMGSIYRFMKIERKGTIDYAAIPELNNIEIEKYRKNATYSWKLTNDNVIL